MITQNEILDSFTSLTLDELDSVRLMNRVDSKYILPVSRVPDLLKKVSSYYRVLEIEGKREFFYNTVYYDTPAYHFYDEHMRGKTERDKVRVRTYEINEISYLEVKHKSNKGRTSKTRIKRKGEQCIDDSKSQKFLSERISVSTSELKPAIISRFTRITLASLNAGERITIDYNISYTNKKGEMVELPYLAIAEVKRDRSNGISFLSGSLKQMGIRQTGFSKYCMGVTLLDDVPRKNNAKQKILMLNKIKDENAKYDIA